MTWPLLLTTVRSISGNRILWTLFREPLWGPHTATCYICSLPGHFLKVTILELLHLVCFFFSLCQVGSCYVNSLTGSKREIMLNFDVWYITMPNRGDWKISVTICMCSVVTLCQTYYHVISQADKYYVKCLPFMAHKMCSQIPDALTIFSIAINKVTLNNLLVNFLLNLTCHDFIISSGTLH